MYTPFARLIFLSLLLAMSHIAAAQKGSFLVNNHIRETGHSEGINFEIISDNNGLLSLANNLGVFQYDGKIWDYYHTPSAALSLAADSSNQLFVGCINGFGVINWKDYNIHYTPIYETDSTSELFYQTQFYNGKIYFLSDKSFFIYDPTQSKVVKAHHDNFLNLFKLDGAMYVNTEEALYKVNNLDLNQVEQFNGYSRIARVISNKEYDLALGFDGFIYEIKPDTLEPIAINQSFNEIGISAIDIKWVNEEIVMCSTLDYGCVFINIKDPEYLEILDNSRGLPDNEIYAAHVDKEQGVWVSHEYGLSRILPSFPAKSYSHLPGLQGNLLAVNRFHDKLWLSTSSGVYFVDKDTTFAHKVYYVAQRINRPTKKAPTRSNTTQTTKVSSQEDDKKNKKGKFGRLFGKNKDTDQTKSGDDDPNKPGFFKKIKLKVDDLIASGQEVVKVKKKPENNVRYIRRTKKIPLDVTYKYSKVPGSSGKCKELIIFEDHLLAASTSGLFEIDDSAHVVVDEPISAIQILDDETHRIILSTYDHSVKLYEVHDDVWIEIAILDPDDVILDIFQDKDGDIWLAGSSKVMKIHVTDEIEILSEYPIDNHRFDDILMTNIKDTTFFINTQGYYFFDKKNDKLKPYKKWETKLDLPVNYFKDALNFTWIYNGKQWYEISEYGDIKAHKYFGIFPNLRKITYDAQLDKYWLITSDNDLLAYDHNAELIDSLSHPLFLKKIRATDGVLPQGKKLSIKYDNTFLSFEMSKPDYLGLLNTEYKYKLEGINDHWSDWTSNSQIDFSYLPPGDYTLFVQSRDSFGNIEEAESISFKVATPYWQLPWFYALQIFIFGGLVVISSRLNQTRKFNRILKSALSILTLILIIEFCQSAMASYVDIKSTPVIDFLIDVGTALLVFPLESFLRHLMMGKKETASTEQSTEYDQPATSEA